MKTHDKELGITAVMLLILAAILLTSLASYGQSLGLPQAVIEREYEIHQKYELGDTTVVEFYSITGHIFFIPYKSLLQKWYFVNGVAVYIEFSQSRRDARINRRVLRRDWIKRDDTYILGNRVAWTNGDKLVLWYDR